MEESWDTVSEKVFIECESGEQRGYKKRMPAQRSTNFTLGDDDQCGVDGGRVRVS